MIFKWMLRNILLLFHFPTPNNLGITTTTTTTKIKEIKEKELIAQQMLYNMSSTL